MSGHDAPDPPVRSDRRRWPTLIAARVRLLAPVSGVGRVERALWALVAVGLVGDVVTTYYGLQLGLTESNPVARVAIERFGVAAIAGLKLGAVAVGVGCRRLLPPRHGALVPAGLAVPWLAAVVVNLSVYATVL